jgi:hypothetical protein
MRAIDLPLIGSFIQRRFRPGEGYGFWEYYCTGFSEPCRDLLMSDVRPNLNKETSSHYISNSYSEEKPSSNQDYRLAKNWVFNWYFPGC